MRFEAEKSRMEAFFGWVGAALGALFVAALAVAWWEHLVRTSRPPAPPEPVAPRAMSVDVQLDALDADQPAPAPPPKASDAAERRATLNSAMSRMARAGQEGSAWTETSPMVLHTALETGPIAKEADGIGKPASASASDTASDAASETTPAPGLAPETARAAGRAPAAGISSPSLP